MLQKNRPVKFFSWRKNFMQLFISTCAAMSTLAIWCRVVHSRDVSPYIFDGPAMSGLAFSVDCVVVQYFSLRGDEYLPAGQLNTNCIIPPDDTGLEISSLNPGILRTDPGLESLVCGVRVNGGGSGNYFDSPSHARLISSPRGDDITPPPYS